jgi:hypothetical protein
VAQAIGLMRIGINDSREGANDAKKEGDMNKTLWPLCFAASRLRVNRIEEDE